MAYKRSSDGIFIEGTIKTVAAIGIENMRTKHVADYAGFTEATMYRRFPSKEILLRDSFLYVDKKISCILTQSAFIRNPERAPFELGVYAVWHKIYRYLIEHREETIFLIRYRYSSLYTVEVRKMRQAYNGGFDRVCDVFQERLGKMPEDQLRLLIDGAFEMTLRFAEDVIAGNIHENEETARNYWFFIDGSIKAFQRNYENNLEEKAR